MFNANEFDFFKMLISKLFDKITTRHKRQKIVNNLFFPYERLWAVAVYLFLLKSKDSKFNEDYSDVLDKR
jgi:hypothetical protein